MSVPERQRRAISEEERLDWLRLARAENVGPITFFRLVRHTGSVAAAIAAAPELSRRGGRARAIRVPGRAEAAAEAEAVAAAGARLIAWCEPDYPAALAAIADPPPVLVLAGHAHLLARPCVAVVGARNASAAGCRFAREIARALGAAGLTVISGLARGIDAAAHEGALETGTAAAIAGGIDVVYPEENAALQQAIAERGAAVSEQPPGTRPTARHFPPRNRLISGLSLGALVVEAAPRSGSLITARLAAEQGREVFAVPGSPLDPRCRGSNDLIRNGAVLTERAEDVLDGLAGAMGRSFAAPPPADLFGRQPPEIPDETALAAAREVVLERLGPTPVTVDELIRECQLSASVVQTVLLELELAGRIDRQPGNRIALLA